MRLSAFFRPIPELLAFSLLGLMILSAANAQTRGAWRFRTRRGHTQSGSPGHQILMRRPRARRPTRKSSPSQTPRLNPVLVRRPRPRTMKKPFLSQAHSLNRNLSPANLNPQPSNRSPKLRAPTRNQPKTVLRF